MKKMLAADVRERIDAKREDIARLTEKVSKLQRQIDENDADIKTLQSRCPHEWGEWTFDRQEYAMDIESIVDVDMCTCRCCDKEKSRQRAVCDKL